MKVKNTDLHIHTRYSDGTYRVPEVFRIAKKSRFCALSITDHDSTDSFAEARELSRNYGIEIISGVELSCEQEELDIHILGYFIDVENSALKNYLESFKEARIERAEKMIELMQRDGFNISYNDILKLSPKGTIARPHIAQILVEKGYCYSMQDAFVKYIGAGSKYYVGKFKITPAKAIDIIHQSGGLAFVAHPTYLNDRPCILDQLVKDKLDGIETVHSSYDDQMRNYLDALALQNGLLRSGGSDCHGRRKTGKKLMGEYFVPYSYIEAMKDKLNGEVK